MRSDLKVVAIGGGHGLPIVLKSIQKYAGNITAIATVADDGGSSGRLREELGILPPGDSRNCLVALSNSEIFSRLFQYRFKGGGGLAGHSLGNLMIAALTDITGDFGAALDQAAILLKAKGRVVPPTTDNITLCADLEPDGVVCGQCNIANRLRPLKSIWLEPAAPAANRAALEAINAAEQIVLGPGSLFTSLLPNLLVPDIGQAVAASKAQRVFICNTVIQPGETDGFDTGSHLEAIARHTGKRLIDVVIINKTSFSRSALDDLANRRSYPVTDTKEPYHPGVKKVTVDAANETNPARHDSEKLSLALIELAEDIN